MLSICIYSFYEDLFLLKCLNSINDSSFQDYIIDLYIYSKHDVSNIIELNQFSQIEISILNKRKSYAEICNISIEKAKNRNCDYFLLLNSDTILKNNTLLVLLNAISQKNNLGVVGAFQTEYNGEWNEPNYWTKEILKTTYSTERIKINDQELTFHKCEYVQGACMLIKLEIINIVGFFDVRFKLFYEETEFCRRVRNNFLDVVILEEAKIKHFSGGTWKRNILLRYRRDILYLTNQLIYESTNKSTTYIRLFSEILLISKKQIFNLLKKKDNHKLPIALYFLIILSLICKVSFLLSLFKKQSVYNSQHND
ncbi:MAG: glycosyltransferase family 2 protein [Bacteroidetes bacterium]|nr:glycosyltransferase family 2 protein [Bacteroidota bacterium]